MHPLQWKQRGRDPLEALINPTCKSSTYFQLQHVIYPYTPMKLFIQSPCTSLYSYLCQTLFLNISSVNPTTSFKIQPSLYALLLKSVSTPSRQPNYTKLTQKLLLAMTNDCQKLHSPLPTTEGEREEIFQHLIQSQNETKDLLIFLQSKACYIARYFCLSCDSTWTGKRNMFAYHFFCFLQFTKHFSQKPGVYAWLLFFSLLFSGSVLKQGFNTTMQTDIVHII